MYMKKYVWEPYHVMAGAFKTTTINRYKPGSRKTGLNDMATNVDS